MNHSVLSYLVLALGASLVAACAAPHERINTEAARYGFKRQVVRGAGFDHIAYLSHRNRQSTGRIHVYLEGDGTPWKRRTEMSPDPTPRKPIALALMARDSAPALYLGRPCYFGLAESPGCHAGLWTQSRYGAEVVDSMAVALSRLTAPSPETELVFIGYSGGGTLALLLAERFPQARAVITVAGNLDVGGWVDHHGYTPLAGSHDPAKRPPLPDRIAQIHYVGGRDSTVPPALTRSFVGRQHASTLLVEFDDFGHHCCWASVWPTLLERSQAMLNRDSGR